MISGKQVTTVVIFLHILVTVCKVSLFHHSGFITTNKGAIKRSLGRIFI